MTRRAAWIGGILIVLAVLSVALWPRGREAPSPAPADAERAWGPPDWERWMVLDEPDASPPRAPDPQMPVAPAHWEARRAAWRERWRSAVDIAPLGPSEPGFDADEIREALAPGREALRQCIRDSGGWRAMREASRASSGGDRRRQRRSVSFDVRADGTVDGQSVTFEPPMPEAFDACFSTFFASARLDGVGADGARVELPMGRSRGRRDRSGDAGVPRWRGRGERGEGRRRGGEERAGGRWRGDGQDRAGEDRGPR